MIENTAPWDLASTSPRGHSYTNETTRPTREERENGNQRHLPHRGPTLETADPGAAYRIHAPRTGKPWALYKTADDCGVDAVEPLEVPTGWDDSYEYAMDDTCIWPRLTRLAMDAYLAHAILEIALVPVDNEEMDDSRALLYRFIWPY